MAPAREETQSVKKGPTPLRSIIAGSTAGAVEIGASQPSRALPKVASHETRMLTIDLPQLLPTHLSVRLASLLWFGQT